MLVDRCDVVVFGLNITYSPIVDTSDTFLVIIVKNYNSIACNVSFIVRHTENDDRVLLFYRLNIRIGTNNGAGIIFEPYKLAGLKTLPTDR